MRNVTGQKHLIQQVGVGDEWKRATIRFPLISHQTCLLNGLCINYTENIDILVSVYCQLSVF